MAWYYLIYGFTLCGAVPSLVNNDKVRRQIQRLYLPVLILLLAMFSGFRSPVVDSDYGSYVTWFNWAAAGHLVAQDWIKDPAFVLASYVISCLGWSYTAVAIFYAAAALAAQLYFSKLASRRRWVTLFFYLVVCDTFVSSNMTEIRAAVAIPLMSVSILLALRGKKKSALLIYAVSITFHLSALVGFPALILAMLNFKFTSRWWILSLAPTAVVIKVSLQNVLALLSQIGRVAVYLNGSYSTETIRLFSVYFVVRIVAVSFIMIFYWNRLSRENRLAVLCCSFGLFIQMVFSFNDALGMRGAEVFALFDIYVFMIPLDYLKGHLRVVYAGSLVLLGLVFFHSALNIIQPYQWIFS